jgi:hypothetical protein
MHQCGNHRATVAFHRGIVRGDVKLRESLAKGGLPARLYARRLTGFLNGADRFCANFTRPFWLE